MRVIGIGIHVIKKFCGLMDLGIGLSSIAHYGIVDNMKIVLKTIFDLVTAANEVNYECRGGKSKDGAGNVRRRIVGITRIFLSPWNSIDHSKIQQQNFRRRC